MVEDRVADAPGGEAPSDATSFVDHPHRQARALQFRSGDEAGKPGTHHKNLRRRGKRGRRAGDQSRQHIRSVPRGCIGATG